MEDDLDCAVCLATKVSPVAWPASCGHTFCRRCVFSIVEKDSSKCPLCRSAISGKGKAADVLTGRRSLHPPDDDLAARCRASDPEEYDMREAADDKIIQTTMERYLYAHAPRRPAHTRTHPAPLSRALSPFLGRSPHNLLRTLT